jgi:short-subunit dehydrogenase
MTLSKWQSKDITMSLTTKSMKKIIIIGATSGIGRELANLFAKAGNRVGITGRRQELLDSLQKNFESPAFGTDRNNQQTIETECFDVSVSDSVLHLQSLINKLDGLDLIIYNAGFGDPSPSLEWETDKKTVDINVNGFIEIVNWCFHYFVNQGWGHIAATSSIASNRGNSFAPAYSASKAFMSCYLEGLYLKAGRMKLPLYITDIQPGFVKTKEVKIKGQFWIVPLPKAGWQIFNGIESKHFRVYVSKRWRLIAVMMRIVPRFIYAKFG